MLIVSSTSCNERQLFAKLSCSAIDNVLTNLLAAGLQDFFQVLNISNATRTVNKLMECSPDRIVSGFKHGLFCGAFHPFSLTTHALSSIVNGRVFIFTSTTSAMMSHRILITAECLNAHFFSVFLFVYALQVLKVLFDANFHKLSWIVLFILRQPVDCAVTVMWRNLIVYRKTVVAKWWTKAFWWAAQTVNTATNNSV